MKTRHEAAIGRIRVGFPGLMLAFCLSGLLGFLAPNAGASYQPREGSDDETAPLEPMVEGLTNEVQELRAELAVLLNIIEEMRGRMTAMEQELSVLRGSNGTGNGGGGSVDPGGSDPFTLDDDGMAGSGVFSDLGFPADAPLASPEAAFVIAVGLYDEAFADLSYESPRDKINYVRRVRQWAGRTDRTLTDKIVWVCELQDFEMLQGGTAVITVQVVNPTNGSDYWSRPHVLELSRRTASSLNRLHSSARGDLDYVKVSGIFRVKQQVDENRSEEGLFEEPYLVGPFVTFNYEIDVNSVVAGAIVDPTPENGG